LAAAICLLQMANHRDFSQPKAEFNLTVSI